jgi:hypothetical protein
LAVVGDFRDQTLIAGSSSSRWRIWAYKKMRLRHREDFF